MGVVRCSSAVAESLIAQGIGVAIGAFFRVTANGKVMFERAVMKACGCPNTQEQAEHLMAVSGHLLECMMATYHPPGEFAGRSFNIQWDFRQLWRKSGVDLTSTTSGVFSSHTATCDLLLGIL